MVTNINIFNKKIQYSQELLTYLDSISNNTIVELSLNIVGEKRRNRQNAYYWKLIEIISLEIGESKLRTHKLMIYKFLGQLKEEIYGEQINDLPNTSKLSVKEFTEYLHQVKDFAENFLNLKIPEYN